MVATANERGKWDSTDRSHSPLLQRYALPPPPRPLLTTALQFIWDVSRIRACTTPSLADPQGLWIPKPEAADPSQFITTVTPDFTPPTEGVKATWLGHACVLLQYAPRGAEAGINVLFDPVFSGRCGPSQLFGAPKRFTREYTVRVCD